MENKKIKTTSLPVMGRIILFSWITFFILFLPLHRADAADISVPDEYDTIMEAMEEASAGDTIYVSEGVYNERIKIKEGVNLVSAAGDDGNELVDGPAHRKVLKRALRTIIEGADIEEAGYLVSFPYDTPVPMKLDGFTIRNMPKYQSGVNLFMVEVRGCSPQVVNNIIHGNRSWGGILATGLGVGMGPALETVARPLIAHNVIFDNYGPGVSNGANSTAHIVENEIFDNQFPAAKNTDSDAPAIGIRSYARPVIENNDCYGNGSGVGGLNLEDYKDELVIRGNKLYNNRRAGIGLRIIDGTETNIRALIEDNQINGNLKAGIMLSKVDHVTIRYNTIFDNRKAGIICTNVDDTVINDNDIYGNLTVGVRLVDVPVVTMKGNNIYRNVTAGIDFIGWRR
jgi:parallel beta-helix repeat protein